jgi:hypothetical protein
LQNSFASFWSVSKGYLDKGHKTPNSTSQNGIFVKAFHLELHVRLDKAHIGEEKQEGRVNTADSQEYGSAANLQLNIYTVNKGPVRI